MKKALIAVAVLAVALFLLPKKAGHSYGGLVRSGDVQHREEYSCLGIKYSTTGALGVSSCEDCGAVTYCAGIPYNKKCYSWNTSLPRSSEEEVACPHS